jgi:hypothetical protein
LKLEEISSDFSSAREIIKVLQEKDSSIQSAATNACAPQLNREEDYPWTEIPYTNWNTHKPSRKGSRTNNKNSLREVFPFNAHRYSALITLTEPEVNNPSSPQKPSTTTSKLHRNSGKKGNVYSRNTRKIVIVGDSHVRGCAANVKHFLGKTVTVTGYVNSVSNLQQLTMTVKNDITNLTKKDTLVIWSGANDIAKNEAGKGLLHLFKLIDLCTIVFVSFMLHHNNI